MPVQTRSQTRSQTHSQIHSQSNFFSITYPNGDVYEGEYPTGKGTMTFENGDKRIDIS